MKFRRFLLNFGMFLMLLWANKKVYSQAHAFLTFFPTMDLSSKVFQQKPYSIESHLEYLDKPRLLQAGFEVDWKGFQAYMRLELFQNPTIFQSGRAFSNLPIAVGQSESIAGFNSAFQTEGWLGYVNNYVDISFGSRKHALGPGKYSLGISDQMPSLDALWINIHPMLKHDVGFYMIFVGMMNNGIEVYQRYLMNHQRYFNFKEQKWASTSPADQVQLNRYNTIFKGYFFHKMGIEGSWWRVGVGEAMLIYGNVPTLFAINPLNLWHSGYYLNGNALLDVTLEFLVLPNVRVYGEWTLDDLRLGSFDAIKPTAMGFLLGGEWLVFESKNSYPALKYKDSDRTMREQSFRFNDGLSLRLETVYTSVYMYGRSSEDPFGKIAFSNTVQYGANEWPLIEYYLGFPRGPQVYLLELGAIYSQDAWYVDVSLRYIVEGKKKGRGVYTYDKESEAYPIDFDVIPDEVLKTSAFKFKGPVSHGFDAEVEVFYFVRSWLQLYLGVQNKVRLDKGNNTSAIKVTGRFSTGVVFHLKTGKKDLKKV